MVTVWAIIFFSASAMVEPASALFSSKEECLVVLTEGSKTVPQDMLVSGCVGVNLKPVRGKEKTSLYYPELTRNVIEWE